MIQQPWLLLAPPVGFLAVYATPARGEGAWILWERVEFFSPSVPAEWEIHGATETRAECSTVLEVHWKQKLEFIQSTQNPAIEKVTSSLGGIAVKLKEGPLSLHTFLCLPDTIDPRPRK